MESQFWKNKTVLMTGHTGFKGSWLSLWLQKLGANLIGFSKFIPTNPSLFELAKIEQGMTSIVGDVKDYTHLEKVLRKYEPEIVIHMAAQSLVRPSYNNPVETYATNVMGTVNLFEAIRKSSGTCVVINVTSDKCYENRETVRGYCESDPMGGYDPYSSSKGCAELITSAFRNSFFNPKKNQKHKITLASVRAGNVIGGGDWAIERLIPDIIKGVLEQTKIKIRNPNAIRPWQFVLDPLNGYLMLAEKLWNYGTEYADAWNFGPDESDIKPVSWILDEITKKWKGKIFWEISKDDLHEANYLLLDCSKAKTKLGWFSKMNIKKTIEWIIEWYTQYELNTDMRKITEKQIENFVSIQQHN